MNKKIVSGELIQVRGDIYYHRHKGYNYWHPVTRRHILTSKQINYAIENYND